MERRPGPESLRLVGHGAITEATDLPVTTAVTCPRRTAIHPAIVAQAAATSAVLARGAASPSGWARARRSTNTSWGSGLADCRACVSTCWRRPWTVIPAALHRRGRPGREGTSLHRRHGAHLHPPPTIPRRSTSRGSGPGLDRPGRPDRRRLHHHESRRRGAARNGSGSGCGAASPAGMGHQGVLGGQPATKASRDRASTVGHQRAARRAGAGAAVATALRAGRRARHARADGRRACPAATTSRPHIDGLRPAVEAGLRRGVRRQHGAALRRDDRGGYGAEVLPKLRDHRAA